MPEQFDPYYTWLGIPASEQPADFYRLLGIKQFEENREVISNAADQRMAHVRSFQSGPSARESQRVLNDLSKAAGCLLNPRRKAMYDQHLQSTTVKAAMEEALLPPQGMGSVVKVQTASAQGGKPPRCRPARQKNKLGLTLGLVGSAGLAVIIGVAGWNWLQRPQQLSDSNQAAAAAATGSSESAKGETAPAPEITSVPGSTSPAPNSTPSNTDSKEAATPATDSQVATTAIVPTAIATNSAGDSESSSGGSEIPKGTPKALAFSGSERVELANSKGLIDLRNPFTVEVWVRFAPEKGAHWIAGDMIIGPNHAEVPAGTIAGWQLFIQHTQDGRHRVAFSNRDGYASDFAAVANGWHHIAACGDTRRVTIHVNGRRSASGELSKLLNSYTPAPIPIQIGSHAHLHSNQPPGFSGDLRALRISSICRYTSNFEPSAVFTTDADTQALWDFPGSTGNKIVDLSGHGRDGIIHGAKWVEIPNPAPTAVAATAPTPTPTKTETPSTAAPPPVPTVEAIQPVPNEVSLVKAREQVRKVLDSDFKQAKEATEQLALADKLVALAAESNEDLPGRYAMFEEASKLAAQAGNLAKSLSIIDDFARRFEIDAAKLKAAAVSKSADSVKTTADRRKLAESAIGLLDELIAAGNLDAAAEVAQAAVAAASRAKDVELGKVAREFRDEIAVAKKQWNEVREAASKLKETPDDPELSLRWGRFVCFYQRNWIQGLPYLVKGSDERLAAAAKSDLENATKAEQQVTVGQNWTEAAKSVESAERTAVALRALHWLRQAESQLKGLAKADVEKQIKDLEAGLPQRFRLLANKATRPSGPSFVPPAEFVGMPGRLQVNSADVGVLWKYEAGLRLGNTNVVGVLAQSSIPRGKLRMEFVGLIYVTESMTVNVTHTGGSPTGTASLLIDNKPVGEVGGLRATSDVYKLELNAGEHTVRWILLGDDLGNNSLVFTNAATAQPLALYHNQALINLVRDTPTRARLNVNMNRN